MGCSVAVEKTIIADPCTGIQSYIDNSSVNVFPNPSSGQFEITSENADIKSVEVYDMLGEKVYSSQISNLKSQISLDLSDKSAGIYFLRLKTNKGTSVTKIVISK